MRIMLLAACLAAFSFPAYAQNTFPTPGGGTVPGVVLMCDSGNGQFIPCKVTVSPPVPPVIPPVIPPVTGLSPVFNCTGFATSGSDLTGNCGTRFPGSSFGTTMQLLGSFNGSTPSISGTTAVLVPNAAQHNANNLNYELAAVNVGQFSSTFTFVPDGQNIAFVLSNNTNTQAAGNASNGNFTAGASCEGSFYQTYTSTSPVNNTLAVMLDSYGANAAGSTTFNYSSVQYYVTGQAPPNPPNAPGQDPCNPSDGGPVLIPHVPVNKLSTSPVALNNPASAKNTTTGHSYSATVTYDGSNLTVNLFDVTAGGSCPGAKCFTNTWSGVNVPAIVGGPTAWVGIAGSTGLPAVGPLLVNTFSYSSN